MLQLKYKKFLFFSLIFMHLILATRIIQAEQLNWIFSSSFLAYVNNINAFYTSKHLYSYLQKKKNKCISNWIWHFILSMRTLFSKLRKHFQCFTDTIFTPFCYCFRFLDLIITYTNVSSVKMQKQAFIFLIRKR